MRLCEYGCGQEARYQFKNGKWCCGESCNSCPGKQNQGLDDQYIISLTPISDLNSEEVLDFII